MEVTLALVVMFEPMCPFFPFLVGQKLCVIFKLLTICNEVQQVLIINFLMSMGWLKQSSFECRDHYYIVLVVQENYFSKLLS
jgi:hypothetical protein